MLKGLVETSGGVESLAEGELHSDAVVNRQVGLVEQVENPLHFGLTGVQFTDSGEGGISGCQIGTQVDQFPETIRGVVESTERSQGPAQMIPA